MGFFLEGLRFLPAQQPPSVQKNTFSHDRQHELVSRRDLGPEMTGHHGFIYRIHLEGNGITASAYPAPGEQLPALVNTFFGLGITPVFARLQKEH